MSNDVAKWLEQLGLSRYSAVFAENAIEWDILPELDHETLKDIGITRAGDRLRLIKAARALQAHVDNSVAETQLDVARELPASKQAQAERRQLTVMFCDLVGSTDLSGQLDPEDLREVVRAYQKTAEEIIRRFDGHIAQYLGDGLLVYFGYPLAHEDDAQRAAYSGIGISQEMVNLNARLEADYAVRLSVRIGIHTGPVVVGEMGGEDRQENLAMGETPNFAARLQGLAEPGAVLISDSTRRLLGELFELDPLGGQNLKGITEPVHVFAVRGERLVETRFAAGQDKEMANMIGRDHELALLVDRWRKSKAGEGQMVVLTGEAGIGKSRIVRALVDSLTREEYLRISFQCSPHHTDSLLYPAIQHLNLAAGFGMGDTPEKKLDKLEMLLHQAQDDISLAAPLLGGLLGLGELAEARYDTLDLLPAQRRSRTLEALLAQLTGLTGKTPVLLVLEDAHWIDPTTLEFIELILDHIDALQIMVLVTARPTFKNGFGGHPLVTRLTLNRLGREQVNGIVQRITKGKKLPPELLDEIAIRTDGVPLFVEELTKTLLESGQLRETDSAYLSDGRLDRLTIPSSLQDSLMARLDRMRPAKAVAQTAACIGREFEHALLAAVLQLPQAELTTSLRQLIDAELIFGRGVPPESTYSFKHALVRDAAYQSLLKAKRREMHSRVAEALESASSPVAPELLAYHYTEAGLAGPAIANWQLAGQQATRSAGNSEAIQHFQKALGLLASQPENNERNATELKILTNIGPLLMMVKGGSSTEVAETYERAEDLAGQMESSQELVPAIFGRWVFHMWGGRFDRADQVAHELFEVASATGDKAILLQAHHAVWPTQMLRGEFEVSNEHVDKGLAIYDYEKHKQHAFLYLGHDPAVCGHSLKAGITWVLGFPDCAHGHAAQALQHARRMGHASTLAYALFNVCLYHAARGDERATWPTADELWHLSSERQLVYTGAGAQVFGGWAMVKLGQTDAGLDQMREGIATWDRLEQHMFRQAVYCLYAEALVTVREYALAMDELKQGLALGVQTGERWWESRALLLHARVVLEQGDSEAAEEILRRSIEVACRQKAKSWELLATINLSRLWADQGRRNDAYGLLSPIYEWFTEGFDTADLKEAKALLDGLR